MNQKAIEVQLASAQSKIDQAKALLDLYEKQSARCRSGPESRCVGAASRSVAGGPARDRGNLGGEVIQLDKLKAALQIAETQARDIQIGQPASIDTHNGIIPGHVSRIDPSVLNGTRDG